MRNDMTNIAKILDNAPCGIGLFRVSDGKAIFLNRKFHEIIGCACGQYISRPEIGGHVTEEDREDLLDIIEKLKRGQSCGGFEYRIKADDGEIKWINFNASKMSADGTELFFISMTDMTHEKEISSKMDMIAENVGASISMIRLSKGGGRLIYANDCFFKIISVAREEYMGNQDHYNELLMSSSERKRLSEKLQETIEQGKTSGELEYTITAAHGKKYWIDRKFYLIKQPDGSTLMLAISWDVTERVKQFQRETYRQDRYRLLVEQTGAAVFEWDLTEGTFECTPSFYKYEMSKVDPDDILHNRGRMDVMHPSDTNLALQFFSDTERGGSQAECVLRLKMVDGNYRWSRLLGLFLRDQEGRLTRVIGTITDIDDEKEKAIMMESLLNALPGGIAIIRLSE